MFERKNENKVKKQFNIKKDRREELYYKLGGN